jgi:PAS domain S-box-containing protein
MIFDRMTRTLRSRIFFSILAALLPVLIFVTIAIGVFLVPAIRTNVRQELQNSTRTLKSSIEAVANVAVRNHLKAIADQNAEIVRHHLALVDQGLLTRDEAIERVRSILLSQRIGSSGYIYCLNSKGIAVIHPNPAVENTDNTKFAFVREQLQRKEGYLEYDWRNPGEKTPRPKALYMVYMESLDWIISVSSYREEFNQLVNIDDFRDIILSPHFGKSGYAYLVNQQGDALIHPKLSEYNVFQQKDLSSAFLQTIIDTGSGSIEYDWRNPNEAEIRKKIAVYENIPEYGWAIVSSSYLDEVMGPANIAQKLAYFTTLLLLVTAALVSYILSGRLTRPVTAMIRQLDINARHMSPAPLPVSTDDEMGRLAREFNTFFQTIDTQNSELRLEKDRYESLFETSPDAVFLIHGITLIDCNSATISIFAGDKKTIIGHTILDLSPPFQNNGQSSADLAKTITQQATENSLQTFEWIHQRLDGQVFDAEVRLKTFGMEQDKPLLVAFVQDITTRKKAEDALRKSEIKYRQLIENAADAILIAQDGVIVFSNTKTSLLTEYSAEEQRTMPFSQMIHKDDQAMVYERYIRRLDGDTDLPSTYSFRMIAKSGTERTVQLNTMTIEWEEKPATLSFVRDITEQVQLETVLQQAQKMEAIGTLAGGIAHDFNNILMGIQGRISLLTIDKNIAPSAKEHLHTIEEHVKSAAGLTRQLLGFARGGKYQPKPTDLNSLVINSVDMFGRTKKEIEFQVDSHATPVVSEIDRQQIEQVLLNMYVNAWQAMPRGGKLRLTTAIATLEESFCKLYDRSAGSYAKISVCDTGDGMDQTTLQKIFDPFFTTKEQSRGTGLGLASAYGIIKNHNGFITVESNLGQGTTFTIYLPLSEKSPYDMPRQESRIQLGSAETILLVDDEEIILDVGQAMLETLGYHILMARSGEQAIQCLQAEGENIDLVILDLIMPRMDGAATFEQIHSISPSLPVILSSGYAVDGLAQKVLEKGCHAFIQKPFSLAELSRIVRNVLDSEKIKN